MIESAVPSCDDNGPIFEHEGPSSAPNGPVSSKTVTTCEANGPIVEHKGPMIDDEGPFIGGIVPFGTRDVPLVDFSCVPCVLIQSAPPFTQG